MIKLTSLLFFLLIIHVLPAQEVNETIANEINNQVWKPFKKAYENKDAAAFNDLHTDDVLRVTKWGIKLGQVYKQNNIEKWSKPDAPNRTIDFWLEHRIYGENVGYEVGYYKVVTKQSNGESRSSIGRFHVVLKKINGKWLIAQDWDTRNINGVDVTTEDWNKGTPLNLN